MAKKYQIYWYKEAPELGKAFLFNLRDDDVQQGGYIPKGDIVVGKIGHVAAEEDVVGWKVKTVAFKSMRKCEWQGFELPCMVHSGTPGGKTPAAKLRDFNYAVAAVSDEAAEKARALKLPVMKTANGKRVINVELARFERQGPGRRATLI